MLVTLAALNAIFTTWATVLDARRASALMRAHGARVRQVGGVLAGAQVLAALLGAVIGVPLGLGLFKVGDRERRRYPRRAVARCGGLRDPHRAGGPH
jgi:putative ABC transport system permease protein